MIDMEQRTIDRLMQNINQQVEAKERIEKDR